MANDAPRDSPVMGPQWDEPCPECETVLSGVWPDADTERVEIEECYVCGAGPIVVEREVE